jgi:hypothetical protein
LSLACSEIDTIEDVRVCKGRAHSGSQETTTYGNKFGFESSNFLEFAISVPVESRIDGCVSVVSFRTHGVYTKATFLKSLYLRSFSSKFINVVHKLFFAAHVRIHAIEVGLSGAEVCDLRHTLDGHFFVRQEYGFAICRVERTRRRVQEW